MQIVIDISEKLYNDFVLQATGLGESMLDNPSNKAKYAIANGTPLPPHGRLIEESDAIAEIYDRFMSSDMCIYNQSAIKCIDIIGKAPTILEAWKGESE